MKNVIEAWIPPTVVFGLIVAASAGSRFVTAQTTPDDTAQEQFVELFVEADELQFDDKDPPETPAAPAKPTLPTLATLPAIPAIPALPALPTLPSLTEIEVPVPIKSSLITELVLATKTDSKADAKGKELEHMARQLAGQIQKSKDQEQSAELKSKLRDLTRQHFELLEGERRNQIETLEAKLQKLKEQMNTRAMNSEQIIERRMNQLLGVPDALDFYANAQSAKIQAAAELHEKAKHTQTHELAPAIARSIANAADDEKRARAMAKDAAAMAKDRAMFEKERMEAMLRGRLDEHKIHSQGSLHADLEKQHAIKLETQALKLEFDKQAKKLQDAQEKLEAVLKQIRESGKPE
ncbi:MAG: hypothetical protein ABL921_14315 [Pirellula sp.]